MNNQQYTDVVQSEGRRLLDVAAESPDTPVPACGDWTVRELVGHVGQVYGFITGIVERPTPDRPAHGAPSLPAADDIVSWARDRHGELVAALRQVEDGTPCWNWGSGDSIDFYPRRMAHESLVHRSDVESAVGCLTEIDPDLAVDGIDELIDVGMQYSSNPNKAFTYPEGSIHLHRTDGEGEWLVRPDNGALVVTREHAKGDVAVRGDAVDLWRYLWGRSVDGLEVFGAPELAEAWAKVAP